jgi:hypothetical protein
MPIRQYRQHTPNYIKAAPSNKDGWTSSAWYAIEELLFSHGTKNTSEWDDDESIAVAAMQIALIREKLDTPKTTKENRGREVS